eukprot:6198456-Pleurochrysis_carterae.AAC.3
MMLFCDDDATRIDTTRAWRGAGHRCDDCSACRPPGPATTLSCSTSSGSRGNERSTNVPPICHTLYGGSKIQSVNAHERALIQAVSLSRAPRVRLCC